MSPGSAAGVDAGRLARDIETIASFSEADPSIGYSRPTFSDAWGKARDYVIREAEAAGCRARIDAAGNVHARPAGRGWDERAWLCGSHVDSVPTGGKYDGVTGVVAALEVLRTCPQAPAELEDAAGEDFGQLELACSLHSFEGNISCPCRTLGPSQIVARMRK